MRLLDTSHRCHMAFKLLGVHEELVDEDDQGVDEFLQVLLTLVDSLAQYLQFPLLRDLLLQAFLELAFQQVLL